jgi:hypothetical protein
MKMRHAGPAKRDSTRGIRLRPLHGYHLAVTADQVWQLDFVRTSHGPEYFFILEAQAIRAATDDERKSLNRFLWDTGVYQHLGHDD